MKKLKRLKPLDHLQFIESEIDLIRTEFAFIEKTKYPDNVAWNIFRISLVLVNLKQYIATIIPPAVNPEC